MKNVINLLFLASTLQRWNDLIRPTAVGFKEIDKQVHKAYIAYIMSMFIEEFEGEKINWQKLIEGLIFEFVQRTILTDIKPQVYDRIMQLKGKQIKQMIFKKVNLDNKGLNERFEKYLFDDNYSAREKEIINAAHILASKWEFDVLYKFNADMYTIDEYKKEMDDKYETIIKLPYVKRLIENGKYYDFIKMSGQARIQKRWSRLPMNPEISIIAHMYMVAVASYISGLNIGCCAARLRNNFLDALFHDLPEVLTRDIPSPIKRSVDELDDVIKEFEVILIEEKLSIFPSIIKQEILDFVSKEFTSRVFIKEEEKYVNVSSEQISKLYNTDEYSAIDGELIKEWDLFFAYKEATTSVINGTTHPEVEQVCIREYKRKKSTIRCGINFGDLYKHYKIKNPLEKLFFNIYKIFVKA